MLELTLLRVAKKPEGCFGLLLQDGIPFATTIEHTYGDRGDPQYTKIPSGDFICEKTVYYKGGYTTFEITGVVGHSRLLFHKGNDEDDSDGCILVGLGFGFVKGKDAVVNSADGFREFSRRMYDSKFMLHVKECEA
jgi:hypothetical protein